MAGIEECSIVYPSLEVFEQAVSILSSVYPEDLIDWKGGGREQAEQAIASAVWAFQLARDRECYARKLAAAAALFYEVIMLHPLTDGNKRLATLVLGAFLVMNNLPLPKPGTMYEAALNVASGVWSQDDVYKWLHRVHKTGRRL